jgi:hypothetical protein
MFLFFNRVLFHNFKISLNNFNKVLLKLKLGKLVKKSNIAQFHKCHNMLSGGTKRGLYGNKIFQPLFSLNSALEQSFNNLKKHKLKFLLTYFMERW